MGEDEFFIPEQPFGEDSSKSIREILFEAPQWSESYAGELAFLCRQHIAIRSALAYSLEIAKYAEISLRTASTIDEVKMLQGSIQGLERFITILISQMEEKETQQEEVQDVEETSRV